VTCKHCQTEIADKALICYRCGRATTEPRVTPPPTGSVFEGRQGSRMPLVVAAGVVLAALAALGYVLYF
jgi:hypothetical protein